MTPEHRAYMHTLLCAIGDFARKCPRRPPPHIAWVFHAFSDTHVAAKQAQLHVLAAAYDRRRRGVATDADRGVELLARADAYGWRGQRAVDAVDVTAGAPRVACALLQAPKAGLRALCASQHTPVVLAGACRLLDVGGRGSGPEAVGALSRCTRAGSVEATALLAALYARSWTRPEDERVIAWNTLAEVYVTMACELGLAGAAQHRHTLRSLLAGHLTLLRRGRRFLTRTQLHLSGCFVRAMRAMCAPVAAAVAVGRKRKRACAQGSECNVY